MAAGNNWTRTDQHRCRSAQMPGNLHIDLPNADPEEVWFTINPCVLQFTKEHWSLMMDGLVSCSMMTAMANSCMNIVQTFAGEILDVVLPQVYRYTRTYGTISPSILGLTEDHIHAYLGDSIEQVLAKALETKVHHFVATKEFIQSLLRHISKTVNSALALATQTHALESRLPVFFVSGCVASIGDFTETVRQLATILKGALEAQLEAAWMTEYEWCPAAPYEPSGEVESPVFLLNSRGDLKKLVKKYLLHMVDVLKSAQMSHCEMSSCNRGHVCITVGTNIHILSVEGRQSDTRSTAVSSPCDFDAIPGAMPDSDDTHSERCPFSSVTVIAATEDRFRGVSPESMESIKDIADELVQEFLEEDLQREAQEGSCQKVGRGGPEVADNVKLRELTNRLFDVVMSGHDYQIPFVPAGTRMCDTVTYRKLRGKDVVDKGILAHALYLRTEEVVTRCAVQVLLWSELHQDKPAHASLGPCVDLYDKRAPIEAGDYSEPVNASSPSLATSTASSQYSAVTYDVNPEPVATQSPVSMAHRSIYVLLIGEMTPVISAANAETIIAIIRKAMEQYHIVDPPLYDHLYAFLMNWTYKDIYQDAISDLLLTFGSVEELQEALIVGDPSFEEALIRALRKQWIIPTSPSTAKKPACGFFKKHKKQKASKTTPVISLTSDQDGDLQDQTAQRKCPPMSRIAASVRHMCSSSRKPFPSVARALCSPCFACLRPESE